MNSRSYRKLMKLGLGVLPLTYTLAGMPQAHAETYSEYSNAVDMMIDDKFIPWDKHVKSSQTFQNSSQLEKDLTHWLALTDLDELPPHSIVLSFLQNHDKWPLLSTIRRQYERELYKTRKNNDNYPSAPELEAYFDAYPPLTNEGRLIYLDKIVQDGHGEKATKLIKEYWREGHFNGYMESPFIRNYREALHSSDHYHRANVFLYQKKTQSALSLTRYMRKGDAEEVKVRVKLILGRKGVDPLLARLPKDRKASAGVTFDRIRWRLKNDMVTQAAQLLQETPLSKQENFSRKWFEMRYVVARELVSQQDHKMAYKIISNNQSNNRYDMANAEFLSGWLALEYNKEPQKAYEHFKKLYENVTTAQSLSRGAFWAGMAAQKSNMPAQTIRDWHEKGAKFSASFYGQLSREWLHFQTGDNQYYMPLPTEVSVDRITFSDPQLKDIAEAAKILNEYKGSKRKVGTFLKQLYLSSDTNEDQLSAFAFAETMQRPEIATYLSRKHYAKTGEVVRSGYPDITGDMLPKGADPALLSSIVRQESNFDPKAKSHAGARGLAQLMPRTAQWMAQKTKRSHRLSWLTTRPEHNLDLGWAYLDYLLKMRDGNHVLVTASYNAGPGNVNKWIRRYGDPRSDGANVLRWIESIPVSETRNYVQRVLENQEQYLTNLSGEPREINLSKKLGISFDKIDLPQIDFAHMMPPRKPTYAPVSTYNGEAVIPTTKPPVQKRPTIKPSL